MPALDYVLDLCQELQLEVRPEGQCLEQEKIFIRGPSSELITIDLHSLRIPIIEQILCGVQFDFETLPLLVRGDSKEIRLLTPRIALAKMLPTVYSYTYNRYGVAVGTDKVRAHFSAEMFRQMAAYPGTTHLSTAFLGLVDSSVGPLLAEEVVESCNIEIRVKRYHIGSPIHRYQFSEKYSTAFGGKPLQRWDRFEHPVVCFDWRHPLQDEHGTRLADEPLPDDYAALWIDDLVAAKRLARSAFEWIEKRFLQVNLQLIDICFFIDRTGKVLYGEISPDCMRVRSQASIEAEAFDKDIWRSGGTPEEVVERYLRLYNIVFGEKVSAD
jgi:phosphoribosylaminoimidazole-succinocarboxamide synthase